VIYEKNMAFAAGLAGDERLAMTTLGEYVETL